MNPDDPASVIPELVGRYRVLGSLGHGAMGRVFLARDPNLDRDVAVKLLRQDLKLTRGELSALYDRMRQEARASARLAHPNIVALYDIGEEPELGLFLVFELVEGPTLEDQIAAGPVGPTRTAQLARELGAALAAAHQASVLHRDIKPANVILAATGAKIADFGIARVPGSTLSLDGGVLGTPAYSAPESITSGEFSPASDQFSLAATLYEALSGRRAFPGDDAVSVAKNINTTEPPPIAAQAGVDPHVDVVLARGLAKDPKRRYGSAEELGNRLAEALELRPRTQMPTLPDQRTERAYEARQSQRELTVLALGVVLGASLMAAGFLLWPRESGREPHSLETPVSDAVPALDAAPTPDAAASFSARPEKNPRPHERSRPAAPVRAESHDRASDPAEAGPPP
ncbi:MAG: serine/threonine protein kinase [Myxococcales bacterium]|nr:serine/threonine protein kinase [Myxococcales bacterium]